MLRSVWVVSLVGVLCALPSATRGQDGAAPLDGAVLAESIETVTSDQERAKLLASVGKLTPGERERFVEWAAEKWAAGGWEQLAPALARIGGPRAVELLVEIAGGSVDTSTPAGQSAFAALGEVSPKDAFQPLWDAWRERGLRRFFAAPLAQSIGRDPQQGLQLLLEKIDRLPEEERAELEQPLIELVAEAFAAAPDLGFFITLLDPAGSPLVVARGAARGIRSRIPAPAEDVQEEFQVEAERASCLDVLLRLAYREDADAALTLDVYAALPSLVARLSPEWAELLLPALEYPTDRPRSVEIRRMAHATLRRLTRTNLPENRVAWERWWKTNGEDQ